MDIKRLKSQMCLCGLDRKQIAEQLNISYNMASNKIEGRTKWTPQEISDLSQILECSTDYLLGK